MPGNVYALRENGENHAKFEEEKNLKENSHKTEKFLFYEKRR